MPSSRVFYRSVFVVEVLTEEPIEAFRNLSDIVREIDSGEACGIVSLTQDNQEFDAVRAAKFLVRSQSSTEFFGLTEDGEDCEQVY